MRQILTESQRALLRLFYVNPEKSFYMQEVGRMLGKKPGVFQRSLNALVDEGLLTSERRANARYFQANINHPLYPEFKSIVEKTAGVAESLKEIVKRFAGIRTAFLYGSFAKGTEKAQSDVDLLIVVSDRTVEDMLLKPLAQLEKKIQREINYKTYAVKEYRKKLKDKDPFLTEILSEKIVIIKGDPNAI